MCYKHVDMTLYVDIWCWDFFENTVFGHDFVITLDNPVCASCTPNRWGEVTPTWCRGGCCTAGGAPGGWLLAWRGAVAAEECETPGASVDEKGGAGGEVAPSAGEG